MKPNPDDSITAYDVAAVTVHWMARQWSRASPSVAARLRNIADRLSAKAAALRKSELEAAFLAEDPLDPLPYDPFGEATTERVTLPYGSKPPE